MWGQLVQIGGALGVLTAFVLAQLGRLPARSRTYLALNLAGSAVLTADAYHGRQWGFLVLELVWALVSGWGLVCALRRPARRQPITASAAGARHRRTADADANAATSVG